MNPVFYYTETVLPDPTLGNKPSLNEKSHLKRSGSFGRGRYLWCNQAGVNLSGTRTRTHRAQLLLASATDACFTAIVIRPFSKTADTTAFGASVSENAVDITRNCC